MNTDFKKFVSHGLIFSIIFLTIIFIINEIYISNLLDNKNIYRSYKQFISYDKDNLDTIVLGDSHATLAINPTLLPNTFNLSSPSETYHLTKIKVSYLLKNYSSIQTYILPIDVHNFSNYRANLEVDLNYWSNFMSISDFNFYSEKSTIENYIYYKFPFIGNGEEFIENFNTKDKT